VPDFQFSSNSHNPPVQSVPRPTCQSAGHCLLQWRAQFYQFTFARDIAYRHRMEKIKPHASAVVWCHKLLVAGMLAAVFGQASLPARPFLPVEPIPAGIVDMGDYCRSI
jgi:hypothetical protein